MTHRDVYQNGLFGYEPNGSSHGDQERVKVTLQLKPYDGVNKQFFSDEIVKMIRQNNLQHLIKKGVISVRADHMEELWLAMEKPPTATRPIYSSSFSTKKPGAGIAAPGIFSQDSSTTHGKISTVTEHQSSPSSEEEETVRRRSQVTPRQPSTPEPVAKVYRRATISTYARTPAKVRSAARAFSAASRGRKVEEEETNEHTERLDQVLDALAIRSELNKRVNGNKDRDRLSRLLGRQTWTGPADKAKKLRELADDRLDEEVNSTVVWVDMQERQVQPAWMAVTRYRVYDLILEKAGTARHLLNDVQEGDIREAIMIFSIAEQPHQRDIKRHLEDSFRSFLKTQRMGYRSWYDEFLRRATKLREAGGHVKEDDLVGQMYRAMGNDSRYKDALMKLKTEDTDPDVERMHAVFSLHADAMGDNAVGSKEVFVAELARGGDSKSSLACYNMRDEGSCERTNCRFSHDKTILDQSKADAARGEGEKGKRGRKGAGEKRGGGGAGSRGSESGGGPKKHPEPIDEECKFFVPKGKCRFGRECPMLHGGVPAFDVMMIERVERIELYDAVPSPDSDEELDAIIAADVVHEHNDQTSRVQRGEVYGGTNPESYFYEEVDFRDYYFSVPILSAPRNIDEIENQSTDPFYGKRANCESALRRETGRRSEAHGYADENIYESALGEEGADRGGASFANALIKPRDDTSVMPYPRTGRGTECNTINEDGDVLRHESVDPYGEKASCESALRRETGRRSEAHGYADENIYESALGKEGARRGGASFASVMPYPRTSSETECDTVTKDGERKEETDRRSEAHGDTDENKNESALGQEGVYWGDASLATHPRTSRETVCDTIPKDGDVLRHDGHRNAGENIYESALGKEGDHRGGASFASVVPHPRTSRETVCDTITYDGDVLRHDGHGNADENIYESALGKEGAHRGGASFANALIKTRDDTSAVPHPRTSRETVCDTIKKDGEVLRHETDSRSEVHGDADENKLFESALGKEGAHWGDASLANALIKPRDDTSAAPHPRNSRETVCDTTDEGGDGADNDKAKRWDPGKRECHTVLIVDSHPDVMTLPEGRRIRSRHYVTNEAHYFLKQGMQMPRQMVDFDRFAVGKPRLDEQSSSVAQATGGENEPDNLNAKDILKHYVQLDKEVTQVPESSIENITDTVTREPDNSIVRSLRQEFCDDVNEEEEELAPIKQLEPSPIEQGSLVELAARRTSTRHMPKRHNAVEGY
jgi:hypothetical protein